MEIVRKLRKILLIQTAFIGDVVLATPVVEALAKAYPDAAIDFIVKKGNEEILSGHPLLNEVIVFNKKEKIRSLISIIRQVRKRKYDLVVNMHRFGSSGIIAFLSNASNISGFDKNPFSFSYDYKVKHIINANSLHETKRNLQLIEPFAMLEDHRPRLYLTDEIKQRVLSYKTSKYVCIAPASVWYTKQLPRQKWVELINELAKDDVTIYLIGGPGDTGLNDSIIKSVQYGKVYNLAGKLSIKESAALMENAVLNYVNDSGPLHFASAMNAPVCAVFCSTVPGFGFGPLSDFSRVIEVRNKPECKPCNLHGHKTCPQGHFKCADIHISDLVDVYREAKKVYDANEMIA
ncbi:MAG TPA: glycosyltransferase family 9 protein [Cytophagaceae bacterium]